MTLCFLGRKKEQKHGLTRSQGTIFGLGFAKNAMFWACVCMCVFFDGAFLKGLLIQKTMGRFRFSLGIQLFSEKLLKLIETPQSFLLGRYLDP